MIGKITAKQIDAILPQTQCEQCGYKGCMPYAKAIAEDSAAINLCPPGGVDGLYKLAALTNQDPLPFVDDLKQKIKPKMLAVIREAECIGCTKCIQACPVDAIFGAAKQMHAILTDECTGCELCVAPCPVDCIDMIIAADQTIHSALARERYHARNQRLNDESPTQKTDDTKVEVLMSDRKSYIQAALDRVKLKKNL